ncbi:MAG: hypothetical protein LUI87_08710 [Lachnospiraceae bacterium]|nr:hypothetical protein [Lachnospiraceae bacterium]
MIRINKSIIHYLMIAMYICYTIAFALSYLYTAFSLSYEVVSKFVPAVLIVMSCLSLISMSKFTNREAIIIVGIILVSGISYYFSKDNGFLYISIFVIAARDLDMRKIIKLIFLCTLITTLLTIICASRGMINVPIINYNYTLGFGQKNRLGALIFALAMQWFYLRNQSVKFMERLIIVIFCSTICLSIDSFSPVLLLIGWFIVDLLLRKTNLIEKLSKYKFEYFPFVLFFLSLLLVVLFSIGNSFSQFLNATLTGRLNLVGSYLSEYGFSLLGQNVELDVPFDNSYIRIGTVNGILPLLLILYGYVRVIKKLIIKKEPVALSIVITFLIQGFVESFMSSIVYNFSLLFLVTAIYDRDLNLEQKKEILPIEDQV